MGILRKAGLVALFAAISYIYYGIYGGEVKPKLPDVEYFGPGKEKPDNVAVVPFKINVPEEEIKELKSRLKSARVGHARLEDAVGFTYGFSSVELLKWRDYWAGSYDWRKHEAQLNAFPQFKTEIEGLQIHFIHAKPANPKAYKRVLPLLIVHGWPGNVYEFYKLIPILTDPAKHGFGSELAFEVVAPSIPGYGWSDQPRKTGFDSRAAARVFVKLMTQRLKYKKFVAQGGDWGSLVTSNVARFFPDHLYGLHVNIIFGGPTPKPGYTVRSLVGSLVPSLVFSEPQQKEYTIKKMLWGLLKEMGYMHIQATKPDTVGTGLNDSPLGLLAYIGEKFSTWTNEDFVQADNGNIEKKFTKDEVLTIISIYWFNQNIVASQRFYKENFGCQESIDAQSAYVAVPTGYAAFANELAVEPIELARVNFNVTDVRHFNDGGHFAAFELPKELAGHLIHFVKTLF